MLHARDFSTVLLAAWWLLPRFANAGPDESGLGTPVIEAYRDLSSAIALLSRDEARAYEKLSFLTDRIGHRLSGSKELERAISWAVDAMKADGHENVRAERVMVPHWVRGDESAEILAPARHVLKILGLGGTVGTPRAGLTGEVVVVSDYDELEALGERALGKIILYNNPMPSYGPSGSKYGETVIYRTGGAIRAAKLGAVAVLVRSVTARSLRSPHTGAMRYDEKVGKIPAAAVSTEDAELIARLARSGAPVKLHLQLGARRLPDATSANVVAELRGRERPEEIVLLGAHIDSWDVGQGAHDDGAGCAMMMEALTVLRKFGKPPRRTIRVVLFTNEENGLKGASEYARSHEGELARHVAAIESDSGGFEPQGFSVGASQEAIAKLEVIAKLLTPLRADAIESSPHPGADIGVLEPFGVPLLGLEVDGSTYFDVHHSEADTLDKVDRGHLEKGVAVTAVMAYLLADMPEPLPRTPPSGAHVSH